MRASKADKFYMGMLLAIICFCFGLLRIMDEADARRAAERETLIIVEPPTIVVPASQPVQTVYFEPDPEPEEPAAEVFTFREDVPLSAELQEVLWDACQEHKVEYALALGLIETESSSIQTTSPPTYHRRRTFSTAWLSSLKSWTSTPGTSARP